MGPSVTRGSLSATGQRFFGQLFASRYLRQSILLLATNLLAGIFAYLVHPFLGHIMSIQDYGQVAALISFALVLATPTQIISITATKYASSLPPSGAEAQLNDFIRRLTVILLIAGIGITAVFAAISSYVALFFHLNSPQEVMLLGLIFIVSLITPLNQGTLQGLQRFVWYAAIILLLAFLRLVLAIGFVLIGFGINGAILGIVLSTWLVYLVSLKPLLKILRGPRTHIGSLRPLWSYSILVSAVTTGIVILFSLDTFLTRHFMSASDAGLYAALATIGRTVLLITTGITTAMFPRVVALHERGEPYIRIVIQAMLGVLAVSVPVEILFYLAPSLVTKILFGQAFMPISGQLAPYGVAMLLLAVGWVIINYFLAIGNRPFVLIIFLACVLQTGLIARYHATISEVVQAVVVTNAALLLALLVAFVWNIWRTSAKSRSLRKRGKFSKEGESLESTPSLEGLKAPSVVKEE